MPSSSGTDGATQTEEALFGVTGSRHYRLLKLLNCPQYPAPFSSSLKQRVRPVLHTVKFILQCPGLSDV